MTDLNLIEFTCPDCDNLINRAFPMLRARCETCAGHGKVLVKREDLIKLSVTK